MEGRYMAQSSGTEGRYRRAGERARGFLCGAMEADRLIDAKMEQILRMRSRLTRCTRALDGMPSAARGDWTDTVARVLELEAELQEDVKRLVERKREILETLGRMRNPVQARLMELRYINGWSWKKIADKEGYSLDRVYHIHGEALAEIEGMLDGEPGSEA